MKLSSEEMKMLNTTLKFFLTKFTNDNVFTSYEDYKRYNDLRLKILKEIKNISK
jgi:hypothetical protein